MLFVVNVSPANASEIASTGTLSFDLIATGGVLRALVCVKFEDSDLPAELVHDGTNFSRGYSQASRVAVPSGFRYVLRRDGGWPAGPQLAVFAFDTTGEAL